MKLPCITAWMLAFLVAMPTLVVAHDPKTQASIAPVQHVSEQAKPAVAVIEQFSSAVKAGDLKRAGEVLADYVVILESGGAEHSREEYLSGHVKHDAAFLRDAHVQVMHRTALVEESLAWRHRKRIAGHRQRAAPELAQHRNHGVEEDRHRPADRSHPLVVAIEALSFGAMRTQPRRRKPHTRGRRASPIVPGYIGSAGSFWRSWLVRLA